MWFLSPIAVVTTSGPQISCSTEDTFNFTRSVIWVSTAGRMLDASYQFIYENIQVPVDSFLYNKRLFYLPVTVTVL